MADGETKNVHEERFESAGGTRMMIVQQTERDHFQVWLNTEVQDYDGLCIAAGETRQQAIAEAVQVFEWFEALLQSTPAPVIKAPRD